MLTLLLGPTNSAPSAYPQYRRSLQRRWNWDGANGAYENEIMCLTTSFTPSCDREGDLFMPTYWETSGLETIYGQASSFSYGNENIVLQLRRIFL